MVGEAVGWWAAVCGVALRMGQAGLWDQREGLRSWGRTMGRTRNARWCHFEMAARNVRAFLQSLQHSQLAGEVFCSVCVFFDGLFRICGARFATFFRCNSWRTQKAIYFVFFRKIMFSASLTTAAVYEHHNGRPTASVTAPAPHRPATSSKARRKKPSYNTFEGRERWIWDTGSGVDICGQECAPADGSGHVRPASEMVFNTANGLASADQCIRECCSQWRKPLPHSCWSRRLLSYRQESGVCRKDTDSFGFRGRPLSSSRLTRRSLCWR